MNKNTSQKMGGCKAAVIKLNIPAAAVPLLNFVAAQNQTTPENFILSVLAGSLNGELCELANDSKTALAALERGQA